ncbi:hypothetical protein KGA65_14735 [Ideonella sp. B7]|uniref:hypothetical protein n=1 Tax=Ideonella benzenivorans TaxID=2831643 RepID=UPI001CEC7A08|nr:hypothetical protein [Ideonella benzenivorans]MCA6217789.1 hypothetical protein [Ideonella benzenivorans]
MAKKGEPAEPLYGRELFSIIAKTYLGDMGAGYLDIRDTGVWLISDEPGTPFSWAPACDLEGPGAPYPFSSPALPFPFTAKQLAAWMLGGWGSLVGEAVFDSDPDADALANAERALLRLGHWSREARDVLMQAYDERAQASRAVALMMKTVAGDERGIAAAACFERGDPFCVSEALHDYTSSALRKSLVRQLLEKQPEGESKGSTSHVHKAAAVHMNEIKNRHYREGDKRIPALWQACQARGMSKRAAASEIAESIQQAAGTVYRKLLDL